MKFIDKSEYFTIWKFLRQLKYVLNFAERTQDLSQGDSNISSKFNNDNISLIKVLAYERFKLTLISLDLGRLFTSTNNNDTLIFEIFQ